MKIHLLLLSLLLTMGALDAAPTRITILHTNDMHSHFMPEPAGWIHTEPKPLVGGVTALKFYLDRERARSTEPLVLDAGDWMTGTPLSDMEVQGAKGGAFMLMMNLVGYDASLPGNHDFDNGWRNTRKLMELADFPVVCGNLFREGQLFTAAPYRIFQRNGLRVGVAGLTLENLFEEADPRQLDGLEVRAVAATARTLIAEMDPRTDLIILLTHQGWRADSLLATRIKNADVIVGGHSHTRLKHPRVVNGVIIVQAGAYTRNLGRLDLDVEDDRVVHHQGRLISLMTADITPDTALQHLTEEYQSRIDAEFSQVVGFAPQTLSRNYYGESPLGDWLTDLLREVAGADFALLNSGGLRHDLAAGEVTKLDIVQILPFQNMLTTFTCSGEELLTFLRQNARASALKEHGILQVSGLQCRYRVDRDGRVEIVEALVAGKPVDPKGNYTGVTADYVLNQHVKYLGFSPRERTNLGRLLSTVVIRYLQEHPRIRPGTPGRLQRLP